MTRDRLLKIVLGVAGVLFVALGYPMLMFVQRDPGTSMLFAVYVTLGLFLFLSIRNPGANRSLIAFTGWSSLAHSAIMGFQVWRHWIELIEVYGVIVFALIGASLLALTPRSATNTE